jgi:transglutaminase/protease-like cytokinesis protein 3
MDNLDIECDILTGSSNNISHAWNVVKIDDEWYQIDCTFDDPVSTDDIIENNLRYDYFLITDEQMYIDHLPDANTYTCTSDKYMYQEKQADVPYHILDSVYQLSTSISYLYDKGYKKVTFYFPENATIAENIINDDIPISLGHIKGINQFSYTPVNKCGKYYYTTITVS